MITSPSLSAVNLLFFTDKMFSSDVSYLIDTSFSDWCSIVNVSPIKIFSGNSEYVITPSLGATTFTFTVTVAPSYSFHVAVTSAVPISTAIASLSLI